VIVKKIEDALRVALDAAGVVGPGGVIDDSREGFDMIVVFDVDRNNAFANQGSDLYYPMWLCTAPYRDGMRRPAPCGMHYAPNVSALEVQKGADHEEE
jgi:hypothetical protein